MVYDVLIIGGGINGAGIARDAAGRGLKTCLVERDDLAAHTSSASTKLIHGGLRYLEHYEFRLVREALIEREVLLRAAPHIIWPLRFVLPHHRGLRPAWLLRLGLFLYDHLGGRKLLAPTKRVDLQKPPYDGQLQDAFRLGFAYSDCWVEDSRLVVLNAMDAARHGADICTRTECIALARGKERWTATVKAPDGSQREIGARMLVNAAGPWADRIDSQMTPGRNKGALRLIRGGHIVVPRLYDGDHAYIFQNTDQRIFFSIPYERDYTLLGTTDTPVTGAEEGARISEDEITYICKGASAYFAAPVTPEDVVWSYAGVRPLFDDSENEAARITRDYTVRLNTDGAPSVSIYGGKITTYRKLSEAVLKHLQSVDATIAGPWTEDAPLPGGDIRGADFEAFFHEAAARWPSLPHDLVRRLARAYGTSLADLLGTAQHMDDLGQDFGAGLTEREVDYLCREEFAMEAEDILWRRSKLGLRLTREQATALDSYLGSRERRPAQKTG